MHDMRLPGGVPDCASANRDLTPCVSLLRLCVVVQGSKAKAEAQIEVETAKALANALGVAL